MCHVCELHRPFSNLVTQVLFAVTGQRARGHRRVPSMCRLSTASTRECEWWSRSKLMFHHGHRCKGSCVIARHRVRCPSCTEWCPSCKEWCARQVFVICLTATKVFVVPFLYRVVCSPRKQRVLDAHRPMRCQLWWHGMLAQSFVRLVSSSAVQ